MGHLGFVETPHVTGVAPVLADVRVLPPKSLNTSVYLDLNRFSRNTAWAHPFMHAYALWLGPVLLTLLFVVAYAVVWRRRAPQAAAVLILGGVGTIMALGLNQLVARAAEELRPYVTYPHALVLVARTGDYSFPSDHSIVAGGLTASLLLVLGKSVWSRRHAGGKAGDFRRPRDRRAGWLLAVLAVTNVILGLFLCFARVYVGAHYPGDVVAGYLLSFLVVVVVSLLRPVAYWAVDAVDSTALAALFRRPA